MKKLNRYMLAVVALFTTVSAYSQTPDDKAIIDAMKQEMMRNKENLKLPKSPNPYFLSYALNRSRQFNVTAVLGAITSSNDRPWAMNGTVRLHLGDYHRNSDPFYNGQFGRVGMPADANPQMIQYGFWTFSDMLYKAALKNYAAKVAIRRSNPLSPEEDAMDDFSKIEPIERIVERKAEFNYNHSEWEKRVAELSEIFKDYPELMNSRVAMSGVEMSIYKTTTEGVVTIIPLSLISITAQAVVQDNNGYMFADAWQVVAQTPDQLPSLEDMKKQVKKFAEDLNNLRSVEPVTEYYAGPVLFEDGAALAIFTKNLLAQQNALLAGRTRIDRPAAPTLEGRMGKKIIDSRLTVKNYSTLAKYNNTTLMGAYEIDAEGVVPAKEITLVENGILRVMLNSRVPTLKNPVSTGSSRYVLSGSEIAFVTAPGTVHISVSKGLKHDKMKKELIKAVKEEGLEYGYIVRKSAGLATKIYRVSAKDGSETQGGACSVAEVPLSKIKRLLAVSSKENIANMILNQATLASVIYPSAILVDDVEINKTDAKKSPAPSLEIPLKRQ